MLDNQGYLIGSFINPELVKKMLGVGEQAFESSDEEFEDTFNKAMNIAKKMDEESGKTTKRRRKRKIQG